DRAFALLFAWARIPENPRGPEDIAALMAESEPGRLAELVASLGGAADRGRAAATLRSWVQPVGRGGVAPDCRPGRIAAALMRLGEFEAVWPLLSHVPDSGTRAEVIEQFALNAVDPGRLIERLLSEKDASTRCALVLALGNYPRRAMPPERLPALEET